MIASGEPFGHYRIGSKLGEGGMGVVYRAHDTHLGRDVAIKVLPDSVARDPERLARFEREARTLAALNHPNIAAVYGVEQGALVMELVEGESPKGPLALDTVINYTRQIADALEAAHERGIIHRDLKPANIKITPDGKVKLLDFGLAKAMEPLRASDPEHTPTMTAMTGPGLVMGTVGYMSPEQARGERLDHRTDIWAFGVVLYELATGKRPGKDPDLQAASARLRPLLCRCLEPDVRKRLGWIGEAGRYLDAQPKPSTATPSWVLPAIVAAAAVAAFGTWWFLRSSAPPPTAQTQAAFSFTPNALAPTVSVHRAVISPNGKHIAYAAENKLWIRDLESEQARSVQGSDGAEGPIWSPDSAQIAFVAGNELKRTIVNGAATFTVANVRSYRGGVWSPKGDFILLSRADVGLSQVPVSGGALQPVMLSNTGVSTFYSPHFLPGGRFLIAGKGSRARQVLELIDLEAHTTRTLREGAYPVWSATGHILFKTATFTGSLMALPFSPDSGTPSGEAVPVMNGGSDYSVSDDGTLLWSDPFGAVQWGVQWFDRSGKREAGSVKERARIAFLTLSPDGSRAAYTDSAEQGTDIWIVDLVRWVHTRFTSAPEADHMPAWAPSGKEIAFVSNRAGHPNIYVQAPDGASDAKLAIGGPGPDSMPAWSPDGQTLLFSRLDSKTGTDLWLARRRADASFDDPAPWLKTSFEESEASFSPDGRFVAYASNESGRQEIFVRSFPSAGDRRQISANGGENARWSRDGKELFYLQGDMLMAVQMGSALSVPRELFKSPILAPMRSLFPYDVAAGGKRFLFANAEAIESLRPASIHVRQNWPALLKKAK